MSIIFAILKQSLFSMFPNFFQSVPSVIFAMAWQTFFPEFRNILKKLAIYMVSYWTTRKRSCMETSHKIEEATEMIYRSSLNCSQTCNLNIVLLYFHSAEELHPVKNIMPEV